MKTAAAARALEGTRVLEIADASGVYCGKLLADMGADVIKLERPGGDSTRDVPPFAGGTPGPERSLFFHYMNTSKRSVTLDLEREGVRDWLRRIALSCDLVVETLAPGRLDDLGAGYAALRAERPALVLTSITGFGGEGPHAGWRAGDLVAGAMGGAMYVTGEPDDPPVNLAGGQNHQMASTFAATSSLIALLHARRTGRGQHVDISMQETTLAVSHITGVGRWLEDGVIPRREGSGLTASTPCGAYPCRDGLVYLTVNRPAHWKALAEWIHEETGNEEVLLPLFEGPSSSRQEYRELIDLFVSDMTRLHTVDEIYHEGQRRHIAFSPLNRPAEVARDEQLRARGYFVDVEHPAVGWLRQPGAPYRHARTPWAIRRPAPAPGHHNEEVWRGELGMDGETFAALRAAGAM